MLLVDGLFADAEGVGDLLPRPALGAGVADLERLERLGEPVEGDDRAQTDRRVGTAGAVGLGRHRGAWLLFHSRQHTLTRRRLSMLVDGLPWGQCDWC